MRQLLGPETVIIGVGGVGSAETAAEKIRAGADLVQLYSMMVYEGPSLPGRIVKGLSELCDREGFLRSATSGTAASITGPPSPFEVQKLSALRAGTRAMSSTPRISRNRLSAAHRP